MKIGEHMGKYVKIGENWKNWWKLVQTGKKLVKFMKISENRWKLVKIGKKYENWRYLDKIG